MNTANLLAVVTLLLQYSDKLAGLATLFKTAVAEGRDVTDEELDKLAGDDDLAAAQLRAAIREARAQQQPAG